MQLAQERHREHARPAGPPGRPTGPLTGWSRLGLLVACVVVALVLAFVTGSTAHRAGRPAHPHPIPTRTAAAVTYEGAGPSCVNVWMGGNPNDPNACRPAPSG